MKTPLLLALATCAVLCSSTAFAAVNIFACEPEWGALATQLGGDKVNVYTATTAMQNPHRIDAKPSLIARSRSADLLVCTGAELEIGWLPVVLQSAGNAKIQPGQPGYFEASQFVTMKGMPEKLDRSMGDIHPQGNPHIHTDPRNIALIAQALAQRLAQIDSANAAHYQQRHRAFAQRWQEAIVRWQREAAPLRGAVVVEHHEFFLYLREWLGMTAAGTLEPVPGVEPTVAHMSQLAAKHHSNPAKMVLRNSFNDARASAWFAEHAKVPAVLLPATLGGTGEAKDLFAFFDDLIHRLLRAGA
jgi:zinc/manganese transport system substrate-binding protein